MVSLQNTSIHQTWLPNASTQFMPQLGLCRPSRRGISFLVRAEQAPAASTFHRQDRPGRRQLLAVGATIAPWILMPYQSSNSFAAETKKGFLSVTDKKDGYSFVYPFGWQEVVIEGQDKVFKDVIEPLENVSVNLFPTTKQDIRDLGSPQEHDVDGRAYYTIEFVARAPNYTRHALSAICIGNGKFYTVSTGANERRWEKMKDKLHTVIDSFQIFNV
ncbi:psbP-like protein 1, chloroplastic isoform X4 [Cornus florida]|uniref:psbP-like protein 1, chloroplastic isoform X4 n=1 Tax=Cornus florida TaxID=4283 RepID=UPI0028A020AF|nr:psbP-like protein 1, chloroplastic isoform X4 [Cornus florida]